MKHSTLFFVAVSLASVFAAEPTPVAFIESISGPVQLTTGSGKIVLNSKTDIARILYSDEKLTCGPSAQLKLRMRSQASSNAGRDVCAEFNRAADVLQHTERPPENEAVKAMEAMGRPGGRSKGGQSAVYSPADHEAVFAENLNILWRIKPPLPSFDALLLDKDDKELARVPNVNGAAGRLDATIFRDAIKTAKTGDRDLPLQLVFHTTDDANDEHISFTILGGAGQAKLDAELARVEPGDSLFANVERAMVFRSFRIYSRETSEYESALRQAPDSKSLLQAAINAFANIGDLHRARELSQKLDSLDDAAGN